MGTHRVPTRVALLVCGALALGFGLWTGRSEHPVTLGESRSGSNSSELSAAFGAVEIDGIPSRSRFNASSVSNTSKESELQNVSTQSEQNSSSNVSYSSSNSSSNSSVKTLHSDSFLARLSALWQQQSNWAEIREANQGTYSERCHLKEKLVWIYIWGHFRSFGRKLNNLKSFLEKSGISCGFLVVYTRDEFTNRGSTGSWSPNMEHVMRQWTQQGVVSTRLFQW